MLELVTREKAVLGECPVWDDKTGRLYWIDGLGNEILRYNIAEDKLEKVRTKQNIGCISLCDEEECLVMALQDGIWLGNMERGAWQRIVELRDGYPNNRFNDGKCDKKGRLWCGTMSKVFDTGEGNSEPTGSFYSYDLTSGELRKHFSNIYISNGVGWNKESTELYHIDTLKHCIGIYSFHVESGEIGEQIGSVDIPKEMGNPDGMCVDNEGMIWVALWNGRAVSRWEPHSGKLDMKVDVPVSKVTSCCFGGADYSTLFITTASVGHDNKKPEDNAGAVFAYETSVGGYPPNRFICRMAREGDLL